MTQTLRYHIHDLEPYINWLYFFYAWGFPPRFASIAAVHDCAACRTAWVNQFEPAHQPQAREASRLYGEAIACLRNFDAHYTVGGRFGLYPAWSDGDDVLVQTDDGATTRLCFLRQQNSVGSGHPHLCLADFISPHKPAADKTLQTLDVANVLGLFVAAVEDEMEKQEAADAYRHLLVQTLCDRLAEAAAERLHEAVRRRYWGYAADERLSPAELFVEKYQGRRPAVGYPSLPDQSIIYVLNKVLRFEHIGVRLTDSGMMQPHAAVAGLLFGHPACRHFAVGRIDEAQLCDYAARRGESPDALRRFLAANLRA